MALAVRQYSRTTSELRSGLTAHSAMCRMIECRMGIGVMALGAFQALGEGRLHGAILMDPWAVRTLNIYAVDFAHLSRPAGRLVSLLLSLQTPLERDERVRLRVRRSVREDVREVPESLDRDRVAAWFEQDRAGEQGRVDRVAGDHAEALGGEAGSGRPRARARNQVARHDRGATDPSACEIRIRT
jgi:hypothetical protein